jgi:phosphoglycolate phosphatase
MVEKGHARWFTAAMSGIAPAVLFDLDGTIWDSIPGIVASLRHALGAIQVEVPDEPLQRFVGPPLAAILADMGVPSDRIEDGCAAYRERYHSTGVYQARLYPGARQLLDELAHSGRRLATATSKGVVATGIMLDHFGLTQFFDVVGAAPMDSTKHSKVDVIGYVLDQLEPVDTSTTTMVGDRRYDIEGGRHFSLRTVAVTWGYGSVEERDASVPDAIVADMDALRRLLCAE